MKLFNTDNKETVNVCQKYCSTLPLFNCQSAKTYGRIKINSIKYRVAHKNVPNFAMMLMLYGSTVEFKQKEMTV